LSLAVFIVAMAITHTFLDFIPSVFLGAPDSENALAVLPGHRLLLQGKGYEAVKLSTIGCLFCLIIFLILSPLVIIGTPIVYKTLQNFIGWILIVVVIFMIAREKKLNKILWSSFVFIVSGALGLVVFNIYSLKEPLLPMLSGLFGISTLLLSVNEKVKIPKQKITDESSIDRKSLFKSIGAGTFSGSIISIFPGMGPAQAAILGSQIAGEIGNQGFILLVGGIGTVSMFMSLITLLSIEKARNGTIVVLSEIVQNFGIKEFILMAAVALFAAGIATFLSLWIAKIFSKIITKVNYPMLCVSIIVFVTLLVSYLTGAIGFVVLLTATAVGLIPAVLNIGRNHAMGFRLETKLLRKIYIGKPLPSYA
jgi:putative membrane protein